MKIKTAIVCVGRLREAFYRDAAAEYVKRLQRFGGLSVAECADLPEPKNASAADIGRIVRLEGVSILERIAPRDHVIALAADGKPMDSPSFAGLLASIAQGGAPRAVFVIGGSNGLSADVMRRADGTLSFSPMTFPHQLARIMLLEQLYRANKILAGETYHK